MSKIFLKSIPIYSSGLHPRFSFAEYPHYAKKFDGKAGVCTVEVSTATDGRVVVTVEDIGNTKFLPVPDAYHLIATKVYYGCLPNKLDPKRITWLLAKVFDENGDETVSEIEMNWEKKKFLKPHFVGPPMRVTDYKVKNATMTEKGLLLEFSESSGRRNHLINFKQIPAIGRASVEDRKAFSLHLQNTVVFWEKLNERLSVRDGVKWGARSLLKPDNVSVEDFIHKPDPTLPWWGIDPVIVASWKKEIA